MSNLLLDDWTAFLRIAQYLAIHGCVIKCDFNIELCKYRVHLLGVHKNLDRQLQVCLEVCDKEVEQKYRKQSLSNVYIDRGLNYISTGNYKKGFDVIVCGILQGSPMQAFNRIIKRIAEKFYKAICNARQLFIM